MGSEGVPAPGPRIDIPGKTLVASRLNQNAVSSVSLSSNLHPSILFQPPFLHFHLTLPSNVTRQVVVYLLILLRFAFLILTQVHTMYTNTKERNSCSCVLLIHTNLVPETHTYIDTLLLSLDALFCKSGKRFRADKILT